MIDRCFCEQKTFARLLEVARREGLDLRGLAARAGGGTHCGWCVAYLRRGLATGQTEFATLLPKEDLDGRPCR